jgi:hypothetical protein
LIDAALAQPLLQRFLQLQVDPVPAPSTPPMLGIDMAMDLLKAEIQPVSGMDVSVCPLSAHGVGLDAGRQPIVQILVISKKTTQRFRPAQPP